MDRDTGGSDLPDQSEGWDLQDGVSPPPEDLFKALAGQRRSHVLSILLDRPETSVSELADLLVGIETTVDGPAGPDERAQIKIELVHAHLPLLDDVNLVEFDERSGEVELNPLAAPVEDLVRFAQQYERALDRHGLPSGGQ